MKKSLNNNETREFRWVFSVLRLKHGFRDRCALSAGGVPKHLSTCENWLFHAKTSATMICHRNHHRECETWQRQVRCPQLFAVVHLRIHREMNHSLTIHLRLISLYYLKAHQSGALMLDACCARCPFVESGILARIAIFLHLPEFAMAEIVSEWKNPREKDGLFGESEIAALGSSRWCQTI